MFDNEYERAESMELNYSSEIHSLASLKPRKLGHANSTFLIFKRQHAQGQQQCWVGGVGIRIN